MLRSTERILTTHTGSLPRPEVLQGSAMASPAERLTAAVAEVVQRQIDAGVDIVNDGEAGKPSYVTYITDRSTGFGGAGGGLRADHSDAVDFPDWAESLRAAVESGFTAPACIAPVHPTDEGSANRDVHNLLKATQAAGATEAFMTAASPGVISMFLENQFYPSHEAYLQALGDLMRYEYEAISGSGLILQVDCPDLAAGRHAQFPTTSLEEWKKIIREHIAALNDATSNIPPENMRLHLCWGNYEGPHNHDVALREILPLVLSARPAAISFEAANPRHEHEWRVFEDVVLPDDKVIIPGVIDSTTNYVEHPELVAERIVRFARIVGRERVIAGTDCGFATFVDHPVVFPSIAYAKLASLAEGAAIASEQLWK